MRTIRYTRTLFYHDCVQLFEGMDVIGGNYLCLLLENGEAADKYLAVGISPEASRKFKVGEVDLRSLIQEREFREWFTTTCTPDPANDLELEEHDGEIPHELLPSEGFILTTQLDPAPVLKESTARRNAVLEVWVDPPEAAYGPRIRAETLAGMVGIFQNLVKHAYNKSLSGIPFASRKQIDVLDAHQMDAFVFAPGSFRVFFEASKGPDLFGFVELQRALVKIDELTANADSPEKALEIMKKNKGHVAGAYIRLLDFLIKNRTALSYKWSSPTIQGTRGGTITERQAGPLLEIFNKAEPLGIETLNIHGVLKMANSKNQTWRLASLEDHQEYSGEVKEGAVGVSHLIIDNVYTFECEEHIEEQVATGREVRKLLLVKHSD